MKVKDIYSWTNITDAGCGSKVSRFNDILAGFAVEVFDFYPRKIIERFAVADCKMKFTPTNPIAKVWGFFWKGCKVWCSLDPKDCCAGYRRLLMEELYWNNLDQNSYSVNYETNEITLILPSGVTDAFVVYSKAFPEVKSLDDDIDIDKFTLSLLRLYMKAEYALESDNDINMSANYRSLFQTKLKRYKEMFDSNLKYIVPWALNAANQ